jgi:putative transcriptional regulator
MEITGNLIIAPPAVKTNFWHKTVIIITEHHLQGSMGLVLNKRSQMSVSEFGAQLGYAIDSPGFVYVGGPLNTKNLSFLHTNDWQSSNTMQISDKFSISSDEDILPRLASGDKPEFWRLFLGVCGWGPGQLMGEIRGDPPWQTATSWCLANSDPELVFGTDNADQWCNALDRSGLEFAQSILA